MGSNGLALIYKYQEREVRVKQRRSFEGGDGDVKAVGYNADICSTARKYTISLHRDIEPDIRVPPVLIPSPKAL